MFERKRSKRGSPIARAAEIDDEVFESVREMHYASHADERLMMVRVS